MLKEIAFVAHLLHEPEDVLPRLLAEGRADDFGEEAWADIHRLVNKVKNEKYLF